MSKTASSIQVKELHRREYRRTMRWIVAGSVLLWIILALVLANNDSGSAIVPMSVILMIGLAVTRVGLWIRYRLHMQAELRTGELTSTDGG